MQQVTEAVERHPTVSSECHWTPARSAFDAHRPDDKPHNVVAMR